MKTEYLAISEPLALAIWATNVLGVLFTVSIILFLCQHKKDLEKRKRNTVVNVFLLISLAGCFSGSSLFLGKPLDIVCQVRVSLTLIFLTFCVICILDLIIQRINEAKGKN